MKRSWQFIGYVGGWSVGFMDDEGLWQHCCDADTLCDARDSVLALEQAYPQPAKIPQDQIDALLG